MTKMIVGVGEVWIRRVLVDVAESGGDEEARALRAIRMVEAGNGQRLDSEYSHTLPSPAWTTEEVDDAEIGNRPSSSPTEQEEDPKRSAS